MAATSTPFEVAPMTTATTMAGAFRFTVDRVPDRAALRMRGSDDELTWAQLRDRVDELAGGLHALGLRRGDTVALMIGNRPEFHICRPRGDDARRDAVLDLPDLVARADRLLRSRTPARGSRSSSGVPRRASWRRAAQLPRRSSTLIVADGEAPEGAIALEQTSRRADPDSTPRRTGAPSSPTTC